MSETVRSGGRYALENCTDREEWNEFVERADGPAYTHWGWSRAVATYGHDRWHLLARDRETGAVAAALPLFHVESRLFGSQLLSPAFAERGGIVADPDADTVDAERLLLDETERLADNLGVDFASLRGTDVDPDGLAVRNRYVTFRVPVDRSVGAARSEVKESRRRQIDQAAENDSLRVRLGDSRSDLRRYYDLYLETMRGHGSPPHSYEFFRTLWDELYPEGKLRLSMVLREGSLINAIIDLSLGSTVYQWGVVSDYEHRELNGGSLLLWKSIERAAEEGFDTYEMGRTREGSGVYMFKKSFGGEKTWYDDVHYFPDEEVTLPDPEQEKYERARAVWKRLPLPVTELVGPYVRKRTGI